MEDIHTIEQFYGVYLLYCRNPKYLGRTYIGYTVDPNRRIKQHNKGKKFGGAWKTSNRGPWDMVMIIHGFPNDIAALRFEWAWQHPQDSRRLKHVPKKRNNEKMFDFCLRVLSEMLRTGPWHRLPLTIRWLNQEYAKDFPANKLPPMHMPICYGSVVSKKLKSTSSQETIEDTNTFCYICNDFIREKPIRCLNKTCSMSSHIICLSRLFLEPGEFVPIEGKCPKCSELYLWGDLVRKYKGCYNDGFTINTDAELFYDSDND